MRVDKAGAKAAHARPQAADGDADQIGAPMPGMVSRVAVKAGDTVRKGDPLISLEAMKMETVIAAPRDATVKQVLVASGVTVAGKDLLVVLGD